MTRSLYRHVVFCSILLASVAPIHASDIDPIALITENVSQVCTAPDQAGSQWDIRVRSSGEATVKLILPDDLGITERTEFTAQEWSEVRTTVEDSASPEECTELLMPIFTERFTSLIQEPTSQEEEPSKSLGGMTWLDFQGGVDLTLLDCEVKSKTVTCTLTANSLDADVEIKIFGKSAIYDQQGNKYFLNYAEVANSKKNVPPDSTNHSIRGELVKGVDTPVILRFEEFTNDVHAISKLAVSSNIATGSDSSKYMFDFRDVDIDLK